MVFLTDQASRRSLRAVRQDYMEAMAVDVEDDDSDEDEDEDVCRTTARRCHIELARMEASYRGLPEHSMDWAFPDRT